MLSQIKKITSILLILIVLPIITLAQTDSVTNTRADISQEIFSQRDVRDVSSINGAKIRLMQLQRSVTVNIRSAEEIIEFLRNEGTTLDYDKLYEIVDSLELILMDLENFDYTLPSNEMAENFVLLKGEAVRLTSEFRTYLNEELTEEQKENLREIYQVNRNIINEEFKEKIQENIKEQNIAHLRKLLEEYGLDTQRIITQLENEDITQDQVKDRLKQIAEIEPQQSREEILRRIKEEKTREEVAIREQNDRLRVEIQEKLEQRREEIKNRLISQREVLVERLEERLNNQQGDLVAQRVIENRVNRVSDRRSEDLIQTRNTDFVTGERINREQNPLPIEQENFLENESIIN